MPQGELVSFQWTTRYGGDDAGIPTWERRNRCRRRSFSRGERLASNRTRPFFEPQGVAWWLRAYLAFAAVQGLGIGLTGLLVPAEMQIPLRISPLNARFDR